MSGNDEKSSTGGKPPLQPGFFRRQAGKCAVILTILGVTTGAVIWKDIHSDTVLRRIHHGLLLCMSGDTPQNPHPDMVRLELSAAKDGSVIAGPDNMPLRDALKNARMARSLVMLSLNDVPPASVTDIIRKEGMRHRVILMADDRQDARDAMKADQRILVGIPVSSSKEEEDARTLAGKHPYAVTLPASAPASLFAKAHRDADAVIADASDLPPASLETSALLNRPVDIIVTDQSGQINSMMTEEAAD
ncbi:hypothetical protein LOC54_00705 [Acetobacter sp. AN02]|uniref:hypothetical protein n=1 Tax=Acetobacter sp. AN02 TaxID=2894186 RepID=UPI0024340CB3|nr:hypothetical protein [Acetobacter sp. AN02]MDG6093645.1 hypothetical protein [Acetobacter sp. AN02]